MGPDFGEVRGQPLARRAAEIAVAGGHNILFYGPPGVGKTLLARSMLGIQPPLSHQEALEVTQVYSAVGKTDGGGLLRRRPFRAPHHTASPIALIGGGSHPRPGEVSLAHHGVLFLDELPEFSRGAIEAMRQPLEEGQVVINRVKASFRLPARFRLVAAANPCPCGWYGASDRSCRCQVRQVERYRDRLSGPLLDRIDLQVPFRSVGLFQLQTATSPDTSEQVLARVMAARLRAEHRCGGPFVENSQLSPHHVREWIRVDTQANRLLEKAVDHHKVPSVRGVYRVLRVAQTIADLEAKTTVDSDCVAEALSYRSFATELASQQRALSQFPNYTARSET